MEFFFVLELFDKDRADSLVEYLNYSGIDSKVEFNDISEAYRIMVDKDKRSKAKKYINAFFAVEKEEKDNEENTMDCSCEADLEDNSADNFSEISANNSEDISSENSDKPGENSDKPGENSDKTSENSAESSENSEKTSDSSAEDTENEAAQCYVPKSEKYENFKSSAWTFIIFSILGAVFLALNIVGVLNFYSTLPSQIILGGILLACLLIGLWCMKGINKLKADAESEEAFTRELNEWLKENINQEFIDSHKQPNVSLEINYMKISDAIKEQIIDAFGEIDDAYLDAIIDSFYAENFEMRLPQSH